MARQSSSFAHTRRADGTWQLLTRCVLVVMVVLGVAPTAAGQVAVEPDVAEAMRGVRERADAGSAVAQFTLAAILHYGMVDAVEALAWFRRAADRGYPPAAFQIGQFHHYGVGVTQDDGVALAWYRRAAEAGIAPAQRMVGDFYRQGRGGVEQDADEAARWYRRAAAGDDIRAQYYLGQMYFEGPLPRDYGEAYLWFSVAAGQAPLLDNRKAFVELRNIAAARMTPEAAADAARRAAEWRPARP
ncbi:MAG: sel1 repeat family protein [Acidobacteria bacterium]|nr:sel1 repeat family protein [Acidobacteriota bacterium]